MPSSQKNILMGPVCHLGLTSALLAGTKLNGIEISAEIAAISVAGGVLIDCDKVFEIYDQKVKKLDPDITARCRLLHSIFAFPFGIGLSYLAGSWLPFFAVLLHALTDATIPGLTYNGKKYSTHPPLKWLMPPVPAFLWYKIVPLGWPVKYSQPNYIYKVAEPIGLILAVLSIFILNHY